VVVDCSADIPIVDNDADMAHQVYDHSHRIVGHHQRVAVVVACALVDEAADVYCISYMYYQLKKEKERNRKRRRGERERKGKPHKEM
jgi:hypothetical protein